MDNELLNNLKERKSVLWALINKDINVKLGDSYFSYAWIILEPLIYVSFFYLIFMFITKNNSFDIDIITFVCTGVFPFLYFRRAVQASSTVIDANKRVLAYQVLTVFDTIIARFFLESIISLSAFFILAIIVYFFTDTYAFYPIRIFTSIIMLATLTLGVCLNISVICYYFPDIAKFLGFVYRILIFISGIFYGLYQAPPSLRYYLSFNPLFQIIEYLRSTFTMFYYDEFLDLQYTAYVILMILFFGVVVFFYVRRGILTKTKGR